MSPQRALSVGIASCMCLALLTACTRDARPGGSIVMAPTPGAPSTAATDRPGVTPSVAPASAAPNTPIPSALMPSDPDPAHADPVLAYLETNPDWVRAAIGSQAVPATCAYDRYGDAPGKLYVVAYCSRRSEPFSASVLPAVLTVADEGGAMTVRGFAVPGDGSQMGIDMKRLFPPKVRAQIYAKMGSDRELSRRHDERVAAVAR